MIRLYSVKNSFQYAQQCGLFLFVWQHFSECNLQNFIYFNNFETYWEGFSNIRLLTILYHIEYENEYGNIL